MTDLTTLTALAWPLQTFLLGGFIATVVIYGIFSAILYYHWQTYSTDLRVTTLTLITFFTCTIPLILIMGLMLFII